MGRCSNPDTAVLGHSVILEQLFFLQWRQKADPRAATVGFTALEVSKWMALY